ncbi:Pathogen-related protein [Colletotrichum tropicale]|nr:Pathogen-related protein [Colletotrichum tropicale]
MVIVEAPKDRKAEAAASPALPDYVTSPNAVFGDEGVQWRYGRAPDYTKTRRVWREGKKMNHAAGSLPELVENLVKNWEVEASFKTRLQDWRTVDHEKYTFSVNGGAAQSGEHMLKVGTYNAVISPNEYYSPDYSDFASSHKTFKRMMPTFAWEVLEVYSGPPVVAFKWRHWGVMKNDYVGFNNKGEKVTAKAHGGPIDIQGVTIARVDEKLRLQAVDTQFDSLQMFQQIAPNGVVRKDPIGKTVDPETRFDEAIAAEVKMTAKELTDLHVGASGNASGCPMMNRE